jgi:hypothetical protein
MSWTAITVLALGAYTAKALGVLMGSGRYAEKIRPAASLVPAAVFAGLIMILSLDSGEGSLAPDPRLGGVAVAAFLSWRKSPFIVVVVAAMATTAALRF